MCCGLHSKLICAFLVTPKVETEAARDWVAIKYFLNGSKLFYTLQGSKQFSILRVTIVEATFIKIRVLILAGGEKIGLIVHNKLLTIFIGHRN